MLTQIDVKFLQREVYKFPTPQESKIRINHNIHFILHHEKSTRMILQVREQCKH